jgi:hypothetical protein
MDDTLCRRFFAEPTHTLQRHYEMLRIYFMENRSLKQIAEQFGLNYYTVRDLVRDFRAQCRAGQVPPFLPSHAAGAPLRTAPPNNAQARKRPRSPTAAS